MPVPKQRNGRDENATIKAGEMPADWEKRPAKRARKDTDARWTKKRDKSHFGRKNHGNVDRRHRLVRARVEHVFGAQNNDMGGPLVRAIRLVRVKARVGLKNLAYNKRRLVQLERMAAPG